MAKSAPAYGDKHPREELYWNGFEWLSFNSFRDYDQKRNERIERQRAGEEGPDAHDGCDHEGFPGGCKRMGHTVETCPYKPQEGKQAKVLSIMGQQIEFPDEFDAHAMLSVVIECVQERSRQVAARGSEEDRRLSPLDWKEMIDDYNAMARRAMIMRKVDEARRRYIQVAALALAAVQAFDKNRAEALREEVEASQPGGGRRFFKGEQP